MATVPIVLILMMLVLVVVAALGVVAVIVMVRSENSVVRVFGWCLLAFGICSPVLLIASLTLVRTASHVEISEHSAPVEVRVDGFVPPPVPRPSAPELRGGPSVNEPSAPQDRGTPEIRFQTSQSPAWTVEVDEEFEADVYSSALAATTKLAKQAALQLETADEPLVVSVVGTFPSPAPEKSSGMDTLLMMEQVRKELRLRHSKLSIVDEPSSGDSEDAPKATLQLRLAEWADNGPDDQRGTIELALRQSDRSHRFVAKFVQKAWVHSLADFTAWNDDGRKWIVARSAKLAPSAADARAQAFADAERMLVSADIEDTLPNAVRSGDLVADYFTQRLSRPYGDVYREAMLIEVTPERIDSLLHQADVQRAQKAGSLGVRVLGLVAVVVIASLLYLILNLLTRGYYRIIVAVAAVVFVLVGGGVLLVAGTFSKPVPPSRPPAPQVQVSHVQPAK